MTALCPASAHVHQTMCLEIQPEQLSPEVCRFSKPKKKLPCDLPAGLQLDLTVYQVLGQYFGFKQRRHQCWSLVARVDPSTLDCSLSWSHAAVSVCLSVLDCIFRVCPKDYAR